MGWAYSSKENSMMPEVWIGVLCLMGPEESLLVMERHQNSGPWRYRCQDANTEV